MSGWTVLAALLWTVLSVAQLPEGIDPERVICRTRSGAAVERRFLVLADEQFQEEELRRVFMEYLRGCEAGDLYVLASSDPEFFRGTIFRDRDVAAFLTEAPVAHFFRIGSNAFFQYGRAGGEIRWVVLQGENVLRRRFGKTEVWWVGTVIGTLAGKTCEEGSAATLVFASPAVYEPDLEMMGRYYARLNRHWGTFAFDVYPSFDVAAAFERVWICSLEAMPAYLRLWRGENPSPLPGPFPQYGFVRPRSGAEGRFFRYDKVGLGPPAWTKRISLAEPE